MKNNTKLNINKAYGQYVKRAAQYGINPMSKKDFEEIVRTVKIKKPRRNRKKGINTNIKMAKEAVGKQLDKMSGYEKYLTMWRRAKKLGYIRAKNPMSRESFIAKKQLLGNVKNGTKSIVQEAYQTDKAQVPALLKEAKLHEFKISAFDIYKQNKRYKEFLKIINEKDGWIKFDATYYEDLKMAGSTVDEMGGKNTLEYEYDEEEDTYVYVPF